MRKAKQKQKQNVNNNGNGDAVGAVDDDTAIGAILVAMGALTKRKLAGALELQKMLKTTVPLGEFLVSYKVIAQEQLELGLVWQKALRALRNKQTVGGELMQSVNVAIAGAKRRVDSSRQGMISKKGSEIIGAASKLIDPLFSSIKAAGSGG